MCGIFGICYSSRAAISKAEEKKILDKLLLYSQSRGKEASGVFYETAGHHRIVKQPVNASKFIRLAEYAALFKGEALQRGRSLLALGQARLDTNGSKWDNTNNGPLEYDAVIGVHNGIVTNDDELWSQHPDMVRRRQVDSEILLALFGKKIREQFSEQEAVAYLFSVMEGSASLALFSADRNSLTLATNTGSLYVSDYGCGLLIFASELYILTQLHRKLYFLRKRQAQLSIRQILPRTAMVIHVNEASSEPYNGRIAHALL